MRWRIEWDYQELKQEFGLGHYEGRGWRGFHHHATLSIAAYGFLVGQRLTPGGTQKSPLDQGAYVLPEDYTPRGSGARAAARSRFNRDPAVFDCSQTRALVASVSRLSRGALHL